MVFARYEKGISPKKHFLSCEPLKTTTTARNIFNRVKSFFNTNDILLQAIRSICTNGAPAKLQNQSEFVTLIKNKILEMRATHCIFHCQALVSKTLLATMKNMMDL